MPAFAGAGMVAKERPEAGTPGDARILAAVDDAGHGRRLARSTAIFSLATAVSRVLGLVREIVSAYYFGVSGKINAFTVAIQLPNLFRALLADAALSGAFVPVFAGLLEKGERARAWRVASTIFWLTLLSLGGLTAAFILLAPLILKPFGDPGGDFDLTVGLARVLFPTVVLLGLSGIVVGILNAHDRFAVPALAPVAWNLVIILGLVLGVPKASSEDAELYVYAGAVLLGTLVMFLLPLPWLRGLDGRLRVAIDVHDPAVRRFFILMIPVTLTLGLINVNAVVDTLFASRLLDPELAPAAIDKAFRVYMLPQGLFAVAVTTVLFPTLSRLAARGDDPEFRRTVAAGMGQIGFLLVPASLFAIVLAKPIVRLVYARGAFSEDDVGVVAGCLAAFSVGLAFNGWMLLLNRAFYSRQSNWTPTVVALGAVGANAALDAVLYRLGVWGIPLATATVNILGTAALLVLMRRSVGFYALGRTFSELGRIVIAAIVAAGLAWGTWWLADTWLGQSLLGQVVSLGAAFAVAAVVYLGLARAFGVPQLRALLTLRAPRDDAR
jgi:putative peptidoglycan lipid II flippase